MTYHLPNSVKSNFPRKKTELCTCSRSASVFPAVAYNNRISAKLSSEKKRKKGRGREDKNCQGSLLSLMEPEPPEGALVFLFDLFPVI